MTYYQPGRYECQIQNQGFGESEYKGTPFFFITFYLHADGSDAQLRDVRLYLSDGAAKMSIAKMKRLGITISSFRQLDPTVDGYTSLAGKVVELECKRETNGDYTNEKWDVPWDNQLTAKDGLSRRLDTLFGSELRKASAAPSNGAKVDPRAVEKPKPSTTDKDEIPF